VLAIHRDCISIGDMTANQCQIIQVYEVWELLHDNVYSSLHSLGPTP